MDTVRGSFEEKSRPPLKLSISAHVCTATPTARQKHRVWEYRAETRPSVIMKNWHMGYKKIQDFRLISNLKNNWGKMGQNQDFWQKMSFEKNSFLIKSCLKNIFSQLFFHIQNQHKILDNLIWYGTVPHITLFLENNSFFIITYYWCT